jgi:hypothetical protein
MTSGHRGQQCHVDWLFAMFRTDTFDCWVRIGVWAPVDGPTSPPRPSTDIGGPHETNPGDSK